MRDKFEKQQLQWSILVEEQGVWLSVAYDSARSALQRVKRSLVVGIITEHLFLAYTKRWWEASVVQ